MDLENNPVISAQVVLRTPSGKPAAGHVTAENIREFLPTPEIASSVRTAFAAAGFQAGPLVGNSFSISATVGVFENLFKIHLRHKQKGGVASVSVQESGGYELPLQALPRGVIENVEAVTFTPPPDFGPTRFGP
jgi:hypothetical protein